MNSKIFINDEFANEDKTPAAKCVFWSQFFCQILNHHATFHFFFFLLFDQDMQLINSNDGILA